MTAIRRARMLEAEQQLLRDKARMNSEAGLDMIQDSVQELFTEVQKECQQIRERGSLQIRCSAEFRKGNALQSCAITNGQIGLTIAWRQRFSNTLDDSGLIVREYNGGLILPNEASQGRIYVNEPKVLRELKYLPDLSTVREYGWKEEKGQDFISSRSLASQCVIQFLDLASRLARGEVKRRSFP